MTEQNRELQVVTTEEFVTGERGPIKEWRSRVCGGFKARTVKILKLGGDK